LRRFGDGPRVPQGAPQEFQHWIVAPPEVEFDNLRFLARDGFSAGFTFLPKAPASASSPSFPRIRLCCSSVSPDPAAVVTIHHSGREKLQPNSLAIAAWNSSRRVID